MDELKTLVEMIAKALVDAPEFGIRSGDGRKKRTIIELRAAAGDLGNVIGKTGTKLGKRCVWEILE